MIDAWWQAHAIEYIWMVVLWAILAVSYGVVRLVSWWRCR